MTPIINTYSDLEALRGTDVYSQALQAILGSTYSWVKTSSGSATQWQQVSVMDTLNHLNITLEELLSECSAAGIVPTSPPPPLPDGRFYNNFINIDGSFTSAPKSLEELKATWSAQFRHTAWKMLAPSDWLIVRKSETGAQIPTDWTSYREAVRTTTALAISDMEATTDIDAFIASVTSVQWPVSPDAQVTVDPAPAQ